MFYCNELELFSWYIAGANPDIGEWWLGLENYAWIINLRFRPNETLLLTVSYKK